MRRKQQPRAFRHLAQLIDEHGPLGAKPLDDVPIVNDLVIDVDRRAVHPRSFARRLGSESEPTPYSSGETFWPFYTLGRFHACCSNNTGEAPELSYIAHDSAIGR